MRTDKLGPTATYVRQENGKTIVRYHDTDVVTFDDSQVTLKTGGWWTYWTKARMNQAASQFGLSFRVYQDKGSWYVWFPGTDIERKLFPHQKQEITFLRRKV